jgi:hypothetical protein
MVRTYDSKLGVAFPGSLKILPFQRSLVRPGVSRHLRLGVEGGRLAGTTADREEPP